MSISELALHDVLRAYARQQRLGQAHKAWHRASVPPASADRVSLSINGRKLQWLGRLAAEMVDRGPPNHTPEERLDQIRATVDTLVARHRDEIASEAVGPEAFEALLRPLYLR
jgi:hypothetical protein